MRVGLGDPLDQPVLSARQGQVRRVDAFGPILIDEHDDGVGACGRLRRALGIEAIVPVDLGRGQAAPQRVERRGRIVDHGAIVALGRRERDSAMRNHLRGSAPRRNGAVGVSADDQHPSQSARQRQEAVIAQQHCALGLDRPRGRFGRGDIGGCFWPCIGEPAGEDRSQDALRHVVETRLRNLARLDRLAEGGEIGAPIRLHGQFLIEPGQRRGDRRMDGAPVGQDKAAVSPVGLEHVGQEPRIFAGVGSVDLIVGAHDGAGLSALDRDLEGKKIGLAGRRAVDPDVEPAAVGLPVVEREVLDGRQDAAVGLHAVDHRAGHQPGQQRILGKIFEVPPAARIANEVRVAAEQHVEPLGPRVRPDRFALAARQLEVPGRRQRQIGGHRRRRVAAPDVAWIGDAERTVGLLQGGNAESGDPRHVTGRAERALGLRAAFPRRAEIAMDERQLLALSHRLERLPGTRVRRRRGISARRRGQGRRREEQDGAGGEA